MCRRYFDTLWFFCRFFILSIPILSAGLDNSANAGSFYGTGTRIIDGDSFQVAAKKTTIEIRLYGIDCPEYSQPYSQAAKLYVRERILHRKIMVIPYYFDAYGRVVAVVHYGGQVLNSDLIKAGLAWVYPRYCRDEICKTWKLYEEKARRSGQGLWRKPHPVAPWKWKRQKGKHTDVSHFPARLTPLVGMDYTPLP